MAKKRASWKEKLLKPDRVELKNTRKGRMLIPTPLEVAKAMRKARKGRVTTTEQIRQYLAEKHGADYTCPLTTGIFAKIVAFAAEEDRAAGKKRLVPWWRTVKPDGSLMDKFPGAPHLQKQLLEAEGHEIVPVGKKGTLRLNSFRKR